LQFISRPFVVGDRIEISSVGGSKFVVGVVERVDPMRTIIRTDSCMPITIPNKVGTISSENAYHHLDRLLHAYHHSRQGWYYLLSKKACQKLLRNLPGSLVFLSRHRHAVFMMHKQYLAHDELESVVIIIIIITSSTSTVMLMAALLLKQAWGSLL